MFLEELYVRTVILHAKGAAVVDCSQTRQKRAQSAKKPCGEIIESL